MTIDELIQIEKDKIQELEKSKGVKIDALRQDLDWLCFQDKTFAVNILIEEAENYIKQLQNFYAEKIACLHRSLDWLNSQKEKEITMDKIHERLKELAGGDCYNPYGDGVILSYNAYDETICVCDIGKLNGFRTKSVYLPHEYAQDIKIQIIKEFGEEAVTDYLTTT